MTFDVLTVADDVWIEVVSSLCLEDIVALCSTCKHLSPLLGTRAVWVNLIQGPDSPSYLARLLRRYPLRGLDVAQIIQLVRRSLEFRVSWNDKTKVFPSIRQIALTERPILWTHLLHGRWLLMSWAECALCCRDLLTGQDIHAEGVGEWHADGAVESGRVLSSTPKGAVIALTLADETCADTYIIEMALTSSCGDQTARFSVISRLDGSSNVLDNRGYHVLFGRTNAGPSPHVVDLRTPAVKIILPGGGAESVNSGTFIPGGIILHRDTKVELYAFHESADFSTVTKARTLQLLNCVHYIWGASSLRPYRSPLLQTESETLLFTLSPYSAEARLIPHDLEPDAEGEDVPVPYLNALRGVLITHGQLREWTIGDATTKIIWLQNNYWDKTRLFGCNFVHSPEVGKRKSNCFGDACEIYTGWDIPSISASTALQLDEGLGLATIATSTGSVFVLDFMQDRPLPFVCPPH